MASSADLPETSEVQNFIDSTFYLVTTLNHEELVMWVITFWPLVLAIHATMRWMSGGAAPPRRLPAVDCRVAPRGARLALHTPRRP